jgi:hypothetical protein
MLRSARKHLTKRVFRRELHSGSVRARGMWRYTMAETLREKQRVAVEGSEGACRASAQLSDYAKAKGLEMRPVYDAIAALRWRGALPGTDRRASASLSRFG